MVSISCLPLEIVIEVLHYLPIRSLLCFGTTSNHNRELQLCALSSLRLGAFNSKLSAMVNRMEATANADCLHSVQVVLPERGSKNKECLVHIQNLRIHNVIQKYQNSLMDLEIAMWELQDNTARSLAQLSNLRFLSIRLDHPFTRHPALKQAFWQESPGSTAWNMSAS